MSRIVMVTGATGFLGSQLAAALLDDFAETMGLTDHALLRMQQRRVSGDAVSLVLTYGREYRDRAAVIYVIGEKEIEHHKPSIDLTELEGIHVVTAHDGDVLTVYRNRGFHHTSFAATQRYRRGQRQCKKRHRRNHAGYAVSII